MNVRNECGVVYVAYGEAARREAATSLATLRRHNDLPVTLISDRPMAHFNYVQVANVDEGARWAKLHVDRLTPYKYTAYLDADTRPYGDIRAGFIPITAGWDMAIAPSTQQGDGFLWHCGPGDRELTEAAYGYQPVALQGGVCFFAKDRCAGLFAAWREEWLRFRDKDQGALLRALWRVPVRVWLLGNPWNNGAVISHRFGQARRDKGRW